MYITNIKHLLDAFEKMPDEMPKEVRELTGFLTTVIGTSPERLPYTLTTTSISCFTKGCNGFIMTSLRPDTGEIHWYCPDCEEEGLISGWENAR